MPPGVREVFRHGSWFPKVRHCLNVLATILEYAFWPSDVCSIRIVVLKEEHSILGSVCSRLKRIVVNRYSNVPSRGSTPSTE